MRAGAGPVDLLLEWSQRGIVAFDSRTHRMHQFGSASEAATALGAREVLVAVSRRSVFLRAARVPNAAPEEIQLVLGMRMGDYFPVPSHELSYDFALTQDVNDEGRGAVIAAVRSEELRRMLAEITTAGFRVRGVVPAAYGASVLARSLGIENGAVVQETSEGLAIDIVQGSELVYSRPVGVPGQLGAEISRTHQAAGAQCGTVIGAGGLASDDVDRVVPETTLEALLGAWPDRVPFSIELPEVLSRRRQSAIRQRQRLAGILALAALALVAFVAFDRSDAAAAVNSQRARNQEQLRVLNSRKTVAESDLKKATATHEALQIAFEPAQSLSEVIAYVSNRVPEGAWLSGVSVERGKPLMIRGTAMNSSAVTSFLQTLTSDRRLRDVKLVFSNSALIETTPVVQFSISAFPVGNLPIVEQGRRAR